MVTAIPTITGIRPSSGAQGTTIAATISGSNLGGATAVAFSGSGVTATIGSGGTATSLPVAIAIEAGALTGTRMVTVSTPAGTSTPFTGFTVASSVVPAISGINPSSGTQGTTMGATISGTDLLGATAVTFSGSGVTATIGSGGTATSVPVTIAIALGALTGTRTVTVTTPAGTSTPFEGFTVEASPVPAITGISPPSGAQGTTIGATISGVNLSGATAVGFSGSGVTATIGSGGTATSVPVRIAIAAGASLGTRNFAVLTPLGLTAAFTGFTVVGPVSSVTLTTDLRAPQPPGTTINWTATPTGGAPPYQYKWWLFDGATWSVLANWNPSNTLAWTPGVANTNYRVGVWVKSAGNSAEVGESVQSAAFAIVAGVPAITGSNPSSGAAAKHPDQSVQVVTTKP